MRVVDTLLVLWWEFAVANQLAYMKHFLGFTVMPEAVEVAPAGVFVPFALIHQKSEAEITLVDCFLAHPTVRAITLRKTSFEPVTWTK